MFCAGCSVITGNLGRIIAIEIDGDVVRSVEENDTITLTARAIDASGDTVPDAAIFWELLDADSGFELDSSTGNVHASYPGRGRARARVEDLRSDTISILVTGAPDLIAPGGDTLMSLDVDGTVSPRILAALFDLTTDAEVELPSPNKPVTFVLIYPLPGSPDAADVFLTAGDTIPASDRHSVTVATDGAGVASAFLRRVPGSAWPDSTVVTAVAVTAIGDTVPGSPVRTILLSAHDQ